MEALQYPTLTRTNYVELVMVIWVQLHAQDLWEAVEYGDGNHDDRAALAALLHAVYSKMIRPQRQGLL